MKTKTHPTCECGKAATKSIEIKVRIMGEYRDEWRRMTFCPNCADACIANGLGR